MGDGGGGLAGLVEVPATHVQLCHVHQASTTTAPSVHQIPPATHINLSIQDNNIEYNSKLHSTGNMLATLKSKLNNLNIFILIEYYEKFSSELNLITVSILRSKIPLIKLNEFARSQLITNFGFRIKLSY